MENELSLELNFFYISKPVIEFYEFLPLMKKSKIMHNKSEVIYIPKDYFKYGEHKKYSIISFYDKDSNLINKSSFFLYNGKNIAYVETSGKSKTYELIFVNFKEHEIKCSDKIFDKLDTIETLNRKRLTLINYNPSSISIDNKLIDLDQIIENNFDKPKINKYNSEDINNAISKSYQISIKDLEEQIFIVKEVEDFPKLNLQYLKSKLSDLNIFSSDFETMLNSKDKGIYQSNYNNILNKNKDIRINKMKKIFLMNQPKDYIKEIFLKNSRLNLKHFWDALTLIFFFENSQTIKNNFNLVKAFINKAKNLRNKVDCESIELFQKICILKQIFLLFPDLEKTEDVKNLNIQYFLLTKKKANSILDKVNYFFIDFINNLTEESEIFYYILNIDSGAGYFKKDSVYAFDMSNVKMIKTHLTQYFPDVLIFYSLNNSDSIANTDSDNGYISINENILLKNFNIKIRDYNSYYGKYCNDIAMNIVLILLHEYIGHRKFLYSDNNGLSPKKFINIFNEWIELKYYKDRHKNVKKTEYILSSCDNIRGDSGHFVELCYVKYNNELILNLLSQFTDNGKFLKRPDIFVSSNCKILKDYITLKLRYKNKNHEIFKDKSIEEEISIMRKSLKIGYLGNKSLLKKKRNRNKSKHKKNNKKDEYNPYDNLNKNEDEMKTIKTIKKQKKQEELFRIGGKNKEMIEEDIEKEFGDDILKEKNENELKKKKTLSKNDEEEKEKEKSEDSQEIEEPMNDRKLFEITQKEMTEKYNIKLNERIIMEINYLLEYEKIEPEDAYKLNYLVSHYKRKK